MEATPSAENPVELVSIRELAEASGLQDQTVLSRLRRDGLEPMGKRLSFREKRRVHVYEKTRAMEIVLSIKRIHKDCHPLPSERMKEFAAKSEGCEKCPATDLPCRMASSCAFAEEMRKYSGILLAGSCCNNHTRGSEALSCGKCLHCGKTTCAFDCFRIEHRWNIRVMFYSSGRSDAQRKGKTTCAP